MLEELVGRKVNIRFIKNNSVFEAASEVLALDYGWAVLKREDGEIVIYPAHTIVRMKLIPESEIEEEFESELEEV